MVVREGVLSRFFLIRGTIPLICLTVILSYRGTQLLLFGLFVVCALDVLAGVAIQLFLTTSLRDYQFAALRDAFYALVFYFSFLESGHVPALVLVPSVLTELFVLFGFKVFYRAVILELGLILMRMMMMQHRLNHLLHPAWSIGIGVASIVTGLLGFEITRLEELQASIARQRTQLKETLTELLATTLSPSGIGSGVLQEENISDMLEELCHGANRSRGREIGQRLARVIAIKQAAVSLLTARELEVLGLVAQNKSYRQIAERLQVSEGTVRAHAAAIMRKADVHNRVDLVKWAQKHELLSLEKADTSESSSSMALS